MSWWFSKKNLIKKNPVEKTNQKDLVKRVESKSTCPKWHFGQVKHGAKKTMIPNQKTWISCSALGFTKGTTKNMESTLVTMLSNILIFWHFIQ
jgi:hypothetical protein